MYTGFESIPLNIFKLSHRVLEDIFGFTWNFDVCKVKLINILLMEKEFDFKAYSFKFCFVYLFEVC